MCFITTANQRARIAKEDITCYKIGYKTKRGFVPFFYDDYCYVAGVPQPQIELLKEYNPDFRRCEINEGYHSCCSFPRAADRAEEAGHIQVGVFTIPQDTVYYHNKGFDEYVSETITWMGKIIKD